MLEAIIENNRSLNKFLKAFRSAFQNRPQYRHFQHYIVGLMIYLGSKNLSGVSRAIPDETDQSSLYRFLAAQDWDMEAVETYRLDMLNRRTRRALKAAWKKGETVPVFLIIDDSLVEKTGKKMAGVAQHRSHKYDKKLVLGHVWVTGQLVVMGQSYPMGWYLYRRQAECEATHVPFFSKPELAEMLVRQFAPLPDTQTYVLTDSWYSSQDLLNVCQERNFKFVGAVKANRKLKSSKNNLQVQDWIKMIPKSAFERVKVKGNDYKTWTMQGHLSSGHSIKLVVNRRIGHKKWHYLISTDLGLSTTSILHYALIRWEVENFYRVLKQQLGWGDYQMRDLRAIQCHVLLMMVAYTYLEIQRQDALDETTDPLAHFTLGDLQRQHQQQAQRATIALVFQMTQRGDTLETIYETLAA